MKTLLVIIFIMTALEAIIVLSSLVTAKIHEMSIKELWRQDGLFIHILFHGGLMLVAGIVFGAKALFL